MTKKIIKVYIKLWHLPYGWCHKRSVFFNNLRRWMAFNDINSFKEGLCKLRSSNWISSDYGVCTGYAAPVFQNNKIFGSIGFTILRSNNTDKEKEAKNIKFLLAAAKEITRRLSF